MLYKTKYRSKGKDVLMSNDCSIDIVTHMDTHYIHFINYYNTQVDIK